MFRLTAHVSGRVQRVGFRAKVVSLATEMDLKGLVQNRPDGSVLVIAEGERDVLESFGSALKIKNTLIDVLKVDSEITPGTGAYPDFRKITGPDEVGERLDDGIEILKSMLGGIQKIDAGIQKIDAGIQKLDAGTQNLTEITRAGFENQDRKMDRMSEKQDETIEEIRGLREDVKNLTEITKTGFENQDRKMDRMSEKQDGTIEEIRGLREDLKGRNEKRFGRIESAMSGAAEHDEEEGVT